MVEGGVGDEAVVGLEDEGVLVGVVVAAVGVGAEGGGEGGHEGGAGGEGDGACCVEGLGDEGDGFFGEEEGVRVLWERGVSGAVGCGGCGAHEEG